MKANPLTWISALLVSILFAGLAAITYFLVTQATNIKTLTNQKADLTNVYDRATFDEKILGKQGPVGPKGPKGDPGSAIILKQIQKDYPFSELEKLKVGTPVFLLFTKNFSNASFVDTEFIGAVTSSSKTQKIMKGNIYHISSHYLKGFFKITANADSTGKTTWIFTLKKFEDLKNFDTKAQADAKLISKSNWNTAYDKSSLDALLASKNDKADTYTKTEIDAKIANLPATKSAYTIAELDSKTAKKADKKNVYTKSQIDSKLAAKGVPTASYSKSIIDTTLSTKLAKADTYTKTQFEKKRTGFWQWTRVIKEELPFRRIKSSVYGNLDFYKQAFFTNTSVSTNTLSLDSDTATFHKKDRVVIGGLITTAVKGWQGISLSIQTKKYRSANLYSIKHWLRSYVGYTIKSNQISKTLTSSSGDQTIKKYPLAIFNNLANDSFKFEIELIFNDDYIYAYGKTFAPNTAENQNNINVNLTFALIKYPDSYTDQEGIWVDYVENNKFDLSTAQIPLSNYHAQMLSGTQITVFREATNREFANEFKYEETRQI